MRARYATIAKLQIDLSFLGSSRPPPSPQSHSYYPPARAFFRFACPCSECDGEFDLSGQVAELAEVKRSRTWRTGQVVAYPLGVMRRTLRRR
jgi:hypothetical protein